MITFVVEVREIRDSAAASRYVVSAKSAAGAIIQVAKECQDIPGGLEITAAPKG